MRYFLAGCVLLLPSLCYAQYLPSSIAEGDIDYARATQLINAYRARTARAQAILTQNEILKQFVCSNLCATDDAALLGVPYIPRPRLNLNLDFAARQASLLGAEEAAALETPAFNPGVAALETTTGGCTCAPCTNYGCGLRQQPTMAMQFYSQPGIRTVRRNPYLLPWRSRMAQAMYGGVYNSQGMLGY